MALCYSRLLCKSRSPWCRRWVSLLSPSPFRKRWSFHRRADSRGIKFPCFPLKQFSISKSSQEIVFCLPFTAMNFWHTIGTLTSPVSKKSIRIISFSQSPTPCPVTDGLQFCRNKRKKTFVNTFNSRPRKSPSNEDWVSINHNLRRTKHTIHAFLKN